MGIIKDTLYKIANKRLLGTFKAQSIFPYYHLVKNEKVAHIENLYEFKNVAQFEKDLDVLTKNYSPIHPKELLHSQSSNRFLITFDDGLEEIYSVVYPILKHKKIPAVFFINPAFVDNNIGLYKHHVSVILTHLKKSGYPKDSLDKISALFDFRYTTNQEFVTHLKRIPYTERHKVADILKLLNIDIDAYLKETKPYISKQQIQEMIADGFFFGGHTLTHPPLNELTLQEQKTEIIDSIDWLKQHFGINYSMFAFPFSDKSASRALLDALFEYDPNILLFGNAGLKKDVNNRIIQRTSFENPNKEVEKHIVSENLYKYYNMFTGQYHIKRK